MYPRGHVDCQPREEGGEIIKNNSPEIRREVKNALWYSEMLMTRYDKKRGINLDYSGPETAPTETSFSNEYWRLTWQWCPVRFPFCLKHICLWISFLWCVWQLTRLPQTHLPFYFFFCGKIHGLEKPAWDCCSVCAHMWLRQEFGELAAFTSASEYFEVYLSLD